MAMTINEAIIHARTVAESRDDMCAECRQEHEQLAEWLEELKEYKNHDRWTIHAQDSLVATKAYNKAIDDVLEKLNKHYDNVANEQKYPHYDYYCNGVDDCIDIVERLKVGGE